jgi:pimeloyl-ACP methyl ester carboxylesterase
MLMAVSIAIVAAAVCAWATLCLLFWQGSWQLLYHPTSAVARTPASVGLAFDSIGFAATEAGELRLKGWWLAGDPGSRFTAIYLHGADGNLGDTVDALLPLHRAGLNVFAFDYRGYGASKFERPSEARMREDAESAIAYLTNTRGVPAGSLILVGRGLGANLALEVAAAHPELAGLVMDEPLAAPTDAIFADARARMVPAHLLVSDRWDSNQPAAKLSIPSLWFYRLHANGKGQQDSQAAYELVAARKERAWLTESSDATKDFEAALTRWLDDLHR